MRKMTIRSTDGASMRSVHSGRLERWLGAHNVERMSTMMRGWYGPPIPLLDVPGSVRVCGDGDFIGPFENGYAASFYEAMSDRIRRGWRELGRVNPGFVNAGFASAHEALQRASQGYDQLLGGGVISRVGPTGVANVASTLWRLGNQPQAGGAASAAPGGRACTSATTGALPYTNPASGTLHLTGADFSASVINNSVLVYDRLFDVTKTMNSTATESVTGVPTRYQSSTATDPNYAGGNFLFVEVGGTALAATAHNWTTCLYRNQAGTDNQTLPSLTGNSGAIVDRLDHPTNSWFAPLASGDIGVMDLAQMQCSAAVATGVANFVIGHPLGVMFFPIIPAMLPFTFLTSRRLAPRILDNACLALLEFPKPSTTATTYSGFLYATSAAP